MRLSDDGSGLSARAVARRLSSLSGLYGYLLVRGDAGCTRPVELNCAFETICETCTYFTTSIEFRPTLRRQHRDAERKNQAGRVELYTKLLDDLDHRPETP